MESHYIIISIAIPFIIEVTTELIAQIQGRGGVPTLPGKFKLITLHLHHLCKPKYISYPPGSSMNDVCQKGAYNGVFAAVEEDAGGDVFGGVLLTRLSVCVNQLQVTVQELYLLLAHLPDVVELLPIKKKQPLKVIFNTWQLLISN